MVGGVRDACSTFDVYWLAPVARETEAGQDLASDLEVGPLPMKKFAFNINMLV